jgi:hypothetical protein
MKRPAFSAVSATRSASDADITEITLQDANGNSQTLKLSAQAHTQLISALLSTPTVQLGTSRTMRPVQTMGVRGVHLQSGYLGLEFFVGQNASIHIAFPPEALPQMKESIESLGNPPKPMSAH